MLTLFHHPMFAACRFVRLIFGEYGEELALIEEKPWARRKEFLALNGGPTFKFTEAISLTVDCETQEEVDYYWEKLTADGGSPSACGWLKDKFGLSWQITPRILPEMLQDKDPEKAKRVMEAMMQMGKIDIARLKEAYNAA